MHVGKRSFPRALRPPENCNRIALFPKSFFTCSLEIIVSAAVDPFVRCAAWRELVKGLNEILSRGASQAWGRKSHNASVGEEKPLNYARKEVTHPRGAETGMKQGWRAVNKKAVVVCRSCNRGGRVAVAVVLISDRDTDSRDCNATNEGGWSDE